MDIGFDEERESAGDWRFDERLAAIFDGHIHASVPFYDEIHRMAAEMSDWFIHDSSLIYDLGTSTGEGVRRIYERHRNKSIRFVAIDFSKEMIEKARHNLLHVPDVQFLVSDLNNPFQITEASLVLCMFTLQFLKPSSRPQLLKEIFRGLREGGALVLVEKVLGVTPRIDEMWTDLHDDMKRRNRISDYDIITKRRSLRGVLKAASLEDNLNLLRQAGFEETDIFFKWYNWAGIVAIK